MPCTFFGFHRGIACYLLAAFSSSYPPSGVHLGCLRIHLVHTHLKKPHKTEVRLAAEYIPSPHTIVWGDPSEKSSNAKHNRLLHHGLEACLVHTSEPYHDLQKALLHGLLLHHLKTQMQMGWFQSHLQVSQSGLSWILCSPHSRWHQHHCNPGFQVSTGLLLLLQDQLHHCFPVEKQNIQNTKSQQLHQGATIVIVWGFLHWRTTHPDTSIVRIQWSCWFRNRTEETREQFQKICWQ